MKIGIYSPYLDTAGGGEKYILTIAEILKTVGQVDIFLDQNLFKIGVDKLKQVNQSRHGLNLDGIHFIQAPVGPGVAFLARAIFLKSYDWVFLNSDGSWFFSTAKNSIIHFQIPFTNLSQLNLWQRFKLLTWKQAIYNSKFTQEIIQRQLPIKGKVIYPPVDVERIKPLNKKKQIISVGRFAAHIKSKKHEVLIEAFKELEKNKSIKGWSLHLAGGALEGDKNYIGELTTLAKGFRIFFYPNISLSDLATLYGESSIYWHAAGFYETEPEKFEHFGISTVEAMAGGCVPVVINLGGQKEIVEDGVNGYLWDSLDQMKDMTIHLLKYYNLWKRLSKNAQSRAEDFSKDKFKLQINKIVNENI